MRILVLALALFGLALTSYGQNIYQIRADSVRIYNDCDTAEFILENHTQAVPGFLYNRGRGRTEFRRLRFIDLGNGQVSIGDQDTLDLRKIVGGGGSGTTNTLANLQNVTDTGNVTNNAIVVTGHNKLPDTTAGMEMSVDTSTEYTSQGLRANIKIYDHNTYTPGYLYVSGKGAMVENPENFTHRLRMHPESDGFHLDAEYIAPDYSWYQSGTLLLNSGSGTHTVIGGSGDGDYSVNINGALATRVEKSRNIASDYMARDAVTYLIVDATTTTIKMYDPSFCPNRIVTIKKTVNNTTPVKIMIDGAGLIDGAASITITDYLSSVQLQSDGTNYWILYRYKN